MNPYRQSNLSLEPPVRTYLEPPVRTWFRSFWLAIKVVPVILFASVATILMSIVILLIVPIRMVSLFDEGGSKNDAYGQKARLRFLTWLSSPALPLRLIYRTLELDWLPLAVDISEKSDILIKLDSDQP